MNLHLADFSAIFRRHWHVSEEAGVSSARRATLNTIRGIRQSEDDHVIVCIDKPPYKRKEISPSYKEHREAAPEAMYEEMRLCLEKLSKEGFHIAGRKGYEADDVIATICRNQKTNTLGIVIHSADKDLMQLVCMNVKMRSIATGELYDENKVAEKFGVCPSVVKDVLALAGDKSDGIEGIKGVGFKTAAKWVNDFGGVEGVMVNIDKLPERFQELLKPMSARERIFTNLNLVELMTIEDLEVEELLQPKQPELVEIDQEPDFHENEELNSGSTQGAGIKDRQAIAQEAVSTSLAVSRDVEFSHSLEPMNNREAWGIAKTMYEAGTFGQWANPATMLAAVMAGREHNIGAVSSLMGYYVIKGKLAMSSSMLIGLVQRSPLVEYILPKSFSPEEAVWVAKRVGAPHEVELKFTLEQAKRAGYVRGGSMWDKDPETMLNWRAATRLARLVAPDVLNGLYSAEEMTDAKASEDAARKAA